jgi:septum formation protein
MEQKRKIILASGSEHRKRLLEQIGLKFEIRESEYEEDMEAKSDPYELAKFLALKKGEDVAKHYDDAIIIAADTFVFYDGQFIGKPKTPKKAREILGKFSGKTHKIISGFAIIDTKSRKIINDYGEALVTFRKLTPEEIEDYIATGEPLTRAGGYGLMDRGAVLIEKIDGDFYSVIAMPLNKVFVELNKLGINTFKL